MSTYTPPEKTVVALFDSLGEARAAVEDLVNNSFDKSEISLVAHASEDETREFGVTDSEQPLPPEGIVQEGMHKGAGVGAVMGGLAGLLLGFVLLPVPGVGPILIAGPLASAAVWAGVGALAGGLVGGLSESGVPEDHAAYYAEGVRRGGSLVIVKTTEPKTVQVVGIVSRHSPVNVEERAAYWKQAGWTQFDPKARAYTRDEVLAERQAHAAARAAR